MVLIFTVWRVPGWLRVLIPHSEYFGCTLKFESFVNSDRHSQKFTMMMFQISTIKAHGTIHSSNFKILCRIFMVFLRHFNDKIQPILAPLWDFFFWALHWKVSKFAGYAWQTSGLWHVRGPHVACIIKLFVKHSKTYTLSHNKCY